MITAKRGTITRNFLEVQWRHMPADKFGWEIVNQTVKATKQVVIPSEIVQKKVNAGVVIATKENNIPDELTGNEPAEKPKTKKNVKGPKE